MHSLLMQKMKPGGGAISTRVILSKNFGTRHYRIKSLLVCQKGNGHGLVNNLKIPSLRDSHNFEHVHQLSPQSFCLHHSGLSPFINSPVYSVAPANFLWLDHFCSPTWACLLFLTFTCIFFFFWFCWICLPSLPATWEQSCLIDPPPHWQWTQSLHKLEAGN